MVKWQPIILCGCFHDRPTCQDVFPATPSNKNTYWKNKIQTSKNVASPELIDSYKFALQNGAKAAKISGAGGGGHMIFFTDFEKRHQLITALKGRNIGRIVPFKFVKHGVDVWRQ